MTCFGIIGGTGFNELGQWVCLGQTLPETPYGKPSAQIDELEIQGESVFFLPRHGRPHSIPPHKINYRANLAALKCLGVTHIIGVNVVGGIARHLKTPQLVIPDQIIDLTYGREQTFFDGVFEPLDHIDFTYPYDEPLRQQLVEAVSQQSSRFSDRGVYVCTQGPRLETAAEINALEIMGGDIVGMTAMPEAALAREKDMAYVNLCLVVNPAAGRSDKLITLDDIKAAHALGAENIYKSLDAFF